MTARFGGLAGGLKEGDTVPGINPGIRRLVALLNEAGWRTVDSGDGKTHDFGCDRKGAYVVIELGFGQLLVAESHRLKAWLAAKGVETFPVDPEKPCIQATYDPGDGSAFLDLTNVADDMLKELT